jgi:WD40 repeat protein
MCNCNCFVSCRYLDHTFKLYKVLPDNNKDNTKPLAVHVSCFVNCICKINEHRLLTGLHNGKIIEWDITIDDNNPKAKPHCVHIREIFAHSTGVNAIEYYTRFDLVITAGDDSCICIRKYFDFEMMNYITMNTKYKVMSIKISSLNLIYVLCYNANTKRNVIFAYTVNAIKFAESIEGVYSNMQFTKNGNVIVGNCENGNVMILTAYALNVLAIIRLKNKIYQKCGDIAWVKYEIEENMLLVAIKRGIVFYYKILVDEPERSMYD